MSNRHPGLRTDGRAFAEAVHVLDRAFEATEADLPLLTAAGRRRAAARSRPSKEAQPAPPLAPAGELSVIFLTDRALAKLHADHLDDPSTTDVITFEGERALGLAGEICVSADTALAYSKIHHTDFAGELLRYVVHGWLHLAGYDDLEPRKKRRMRAAENRALRLLAKAGVSPRAELKPR